MKVSQMFAGAMVALTLLGCQTMSQSSSDPATTSLGAKTVTGSLFYRDRSALPPQAIITVTLADVSKQDVSAKILSQQRFSAAGKQVPFNFTLPYTAQQIAPGSTIAVSARIELGEKLLYTSTMMHEVVNNGLNSVDIPLERVQ